MASAERDDIRPGWVSVVMPAYDRAARLPASVASCLEQTWDRVEVVVVDDGSTDETPGVLAGLQERWGDERLRWVRQDNQGACVARNTGMDLARGEFLQFLDSDDVLAPVKFERQVDALRRSGAEVAVCDFRYVREGDERTVRRVARNTGDLHERLARFESIFTGAPLLRRDSVPPGLRWNPAIRRHQDIDFMLRYFLCVSRWVHTPGTWVDYVEHEGPAISDTYHHGAQHEELFRSVRDFWADHRDAIPRGNDWMVRRVALALARRALLHGQRNTARTLWAFAARGPRRLERAPLLAAVGAGSLVPAPLLGLSLRARRALSGLRAAIRD
ncbi:MAG: glycosyltransferase family 2 protein [Myxococcota bacterium]